MAHRNLGVVGQHVDRLANDPEYREAALTAPSTTDKKGIPQKYLARTAPTALGPEGDVPSDMVVNDPIDWCAGETGEFDADAATKDELVERAESKGIDVKKSGKVDEIRDQVKDAE